MHSVNVFLGTTRSILTNWINYLEIFTEPITDITDLTIDGGIQFSLLVEHLTGKEIIGINKKPLVTHGMISMVNILICNSLLLAIWNNFNKALSILKSDRFVRLSQVCSAQQIVSGNSEYMLSTLYVRKFVSVLNGIQRKEMFYAYEYRIAKVQEKSSVEFYNSAAVKYKCTVYNLQSKEFKDVRNVVRSC